MDFDGILIDQRWINGGPCDWQFVGKNALVAI